MEKAKKVSVIVPNYNYARYLQRRLRSIAQQTYPIYELIVLDDASTDGSKTAVKKFVAEAGQINPKMKIKMIFNKKNSGKAISQWIRGIEEASGDYIWIAEADDACRKDFLKEVLQGFDKDPEVVISYTESAAMNKNGLFIAPNFRKSRDKEGTGHFSSSYIRPGVQEIQGIMAIRCTIPNASAVVFKNTSKLKRTLEDALQFEQVGDWYLYAKLLEDGKIFYNKKSMNFFRIHKESATKRGEAHVKEVEEMHEYFRENFDLSKNVQKWMDAELARLKQKYNLA